MYKYCYSNKGAIYAKGLYPCIFSRQMEAIVCIFVLVLGRYLYSTKCSWIIKINTSFEIMDLDSVSVH